MVLTPSSATPVAPTTQSLMPLKGLMRYQE